MEGDDSYLYIDGAYLKEVYKKCMTEYFGVEGDIDLESVRRTAGAIRAFYYDCFDDLQRPNEPEEDFRRRMAGYETLLVKTKGLTGFHLRLGTLSGSRKRLRQKEVDVMLAVDMLTHAFRKSMKKATLIAGDLDFKPIVDALVELGTWVTVYYEPISAAEDLYRAADQRFEMNLPTLYGWSSEAFRKRQRIPSVFTGSQSPSGSEPMKVGQLKGKRVVLHPSGNAFLMYVEPSGANDSMSFLHDDLAQLEKYIQMVYGRIEWCAN